MLSNSCGINGFSRVSGFFGRFFQYNFFCYCFIKNIFVLVSIDVF